MPALKHDLAQIPAKAATCTEIGWNAYEKCSRCSYTTYVEIPALKHDLTQIPAKAATCTEIGWNAYEKCSRCNYTTYVEIPMSEHTYSSVVVKPQFGVQGYTIYTCSVCGYSYKDNYTDPLPYLLGDIDLDGDIDASDLTLLARHSAKIELITDLGALTTADINQDGEVTASDLTKLARHIAKIELIVQN